jgi:hypothetical protein
MDWAWLPSNQFVLGAAGTIVALGVIWGAMRATVKWAKKAGPFIDGIQKALIVLNGRPAVRLPENDHEVQPALPGALDRLESIEHGQGVMMDHLERVEQETVELFLKIRAIGAEVKPNSGTSLRDVVNRIEQTVSENLVRLSDIEHRMVLEADRVSRIEEALQTNAEAQMHVWPAIEAIAKARPEDIMPGLEGESQADSTHSMGTAEPT